MLPALLACVTVAVAHEIISMHRLWSDFVAKQAVDTAASQAVDTADIVNVMAYISGRHRTACTLWDTCRSAERRKDWSSFG